MGKKVSFQVTSLIKGSSTCGAFVWRFLFRFEASKGLILHKPPGLTYYCTFFSSQRTTGDIGGGHEREEPSEAGRPPTSPYPAPKALFYSSRVVMFRAPGAHGKQPPRRPPAPRLSLPARPPPRSLRTASRRRAAPLPAPAAAARARLQPPAKIASKLRRGQTRTPGSLPAANRDPAGFKPVSQGRRFSAGLPRPRR